MKWHKEFLLFDLPIGFLITLVVEFSSPGNLTTSKLEAFFLFFFNCLVVFNVHFFFLYLRKSKKLSIWSRIGILLEKIRHKEIDELQSRLDRIKTVLSEASMLIDNPTPGPNEIAVFNKAVCKAQSNLCAISSKDVFLWEDSTFLFYFMLSGLVQIERKASQGNPKQFCIKRTQSHIESFKEEEKSVLNCLAENNDCDEFFIIRFLIYPESVFEEMKEVIKALLRIHWLFGAHCLPMVVEQLKPLIAPQELKNINDLSKKVGMDESSFPDFLLIDNLPHKATSSCICYYQEGKPKVIKESFSLALARITIKKLSNLALTRPNVIWADYSIEEILKCGLGHHV